jgi:putative N6-adenine-specific DNA methylase
MFYVSCNPGFEDSTAEEIRECWPWLIGLNGLANTSAYPEIVPDRGGLLVDAPLELGLQFNFFLKTAHRVLWRVGEFKSRDFPKLFEKIKQIPWDRYLESANVEWVVSASKSRLNHDKRIEDTCREAFQKAFAGKGAAGPVAQQIFVRIHDDHCTVSLDSSGEHLHKRGWGTRKGEAPLRETLAAFILRQMTAQASSAELQNITLVDPMCGSGTLLLEALSLWRPVFDRDFAFFQWKHTPKIFKTDLWKKNYKLLSAEVPFKAYRGYDLEEKVLKAAQENLQDLQTQTGLQAGDIEFKKENLFEGVCSLPAPVWCVCNPPYGERLRVQGQREFSYDDLLARMAQKFSAEKIGLLLPNKGIVKNIKPPTGYEKILEVPFSNGGLDVLFVTVALLRPPKR